jgi:hypothetical protein
VSELVVRLRGLSEASIRLACLTHWLEGADTVTACAELEALLAETKARSAGAMPALASLVQWISAAVNPTRQHELAEQAQSQAATALAAMLAHAHECPLSFRIPGARGPERAHERVLTLGERKNLARRTGRKGLVRLLADPHPAVIEQLLLNPLLTEPDVVRLVSTRHLPPQSVCMLAREGRWLMAPRVRQGLLHNPDLPTWQTLPLLWLCTRPELARVAEAPSLAQPLRARAMALGELPLR